MDYGDIGVDMYDSELDTLKHIEKVRHFLEVVREELYWRGMYHDRSKLSAEEKPIFDEFTPRLKESIYGGEEYKGFLKEMKAALDHHYRKNRHHPEHFYPAVAHMNAINEISCMNLIDIIEMFCDWKAATIRHDTGDLRKSISINQKRFGISDELTAIFLNSVNLFDNEGKIE